MSIDLRYVQVSDDSSWHLIDHTYVGEGGVGYRVETRCGLDNVWDQAFLDRLPGGDEKSCENCLVLLAGDVDEPAPKKAAKPK